MVYSTLIGNDFRATYAYDDVREYNHLPYCSDQMVRFYANAHESEGLIGIELSKYETHYRAWVDLTGEMFITKNEKNGKITELARESIEPPTINKSALVKFANVDHQLVFQFGGKKLTWDLGYSPEAAGPRKTKIEPQVRIFGSGRLTLSHVAIFRDIHYTAPNGLGQGRAAEDNPFTLGKDEFFVLGDNSPNGQDSRFWHRPGLANKGRPPFLFGAELVFKSDLDNRIISEELRQEFEENQISLSEHVTVSVEQQGSAWVITDNWNEYFVRKEEGRLNIHIEQKQALKQVEIRVKGQPKLLLTGEIEQIFPAGHELLPSEALGYAVGGSVPTVSQDPQGTKAAEMFFEIRIRPNPDSSVRLLTGQRVIARIRMRRDKPLIKQWWRSARQLFQRRFHI